MTMFKPKKYSRLQPLFVMPTVGDCRRLLAEATKAKGTTVELPWRSQKTYTGYSLTAKLDLGSDEPLWTLYEGEGSRARVVWSSFFEDIELMHDVLHLSLPQEELGAALKPPPEPVVERQAEPEYGAVDGYTPSFPRPDDGYDLFPGTQTESPLRSTPTITPVVNVQTVQTVQPVQPAAASAQSASVSAAADWKVAPDNTRQPQSAAPPQPPVQAQQQQPYPYPPAGYGYPANYAQPNYPGYPPGYGYQGYPPGYPVDPRYYQNAYQQYGQMPPGEPPQYLAQTVPVQPGAAIQPMMPQDALPQATNKTDPDLLRKRPNLFIGSFLTDAGLIPDSTIQAALRLQDMVKSGTLSTAQAAEAVRRAHERGGTIDPHYFTASVVDKDVRVNAPPLGQILVEAGLITPSTLKAALNLQDVVRTGAMTKEDAIAGFTREHFGADEKGEGKKERDAEQAIDLLKQAGLLSEKDVEAARAVRKRHGGNINKILQAAGKLDMKTFDAALKCKQYVREDRMKVEQTMILLHYCQRSRMTFDEAFDELGWDKV